MFCSVVIPTIGRSTLSRAVESVLEQKFTRDEFEIIVVNDSGTPLPDLPWLKADKVQLLDTQRRERCVARNAGAAVAQGDYLCFLDDDDCMLPGALECFWGLAKATEGPWLYGGYRMVNTFGELISEELPDESGNCLIRFLAGEWLPLQASLIKTEAFFAVGGFAALQSLLGGDEDVDLCRQLALQFDLVGAKQPVASILIEHDSSTTNRTNLHEQSRQSREKALNAPGVYPRMRASAKERTAKAYWHGRIVWNCLTSVIWNLRRQRFFTALSRFVHSIINLSMAGRHLLSIEFWQGAIRPHVDRKGYLVKED